MFKFSKLKKMSRNKYNKNILQNIIGAILIKGGALIISLITLPAYIEYFDNQQILGLWFTALAVLSWILTFDLGIGNGLRNHLVHAIAEKNYLLAKRYISSAYIIIGLLVCLIMILSIFIFKLINWNIVFNISNSVISREVLYPTISIIFSGIMLQFLFKLISSILYALQESALTNLLSLISSIIILVYVLFSSPEEISEKLISLALVHVLAVNIPLFVATIVVFSTKLNASKPSIKYYGNKYALDIIKLGGMFFWVQIMYMIISTTNEFLITWLTGPEKVVEYQIYNKLFTLVGVLFTLALTPIWSTVTLALSEKNYSWIKKLFKTLKILALLAILCQFALIPFLQVGINLWLGDNAIQVNYLYAIIFAISGSIFIWNGVLSSIANGFGELRIQTIFLTFGAIIKIPIAWILVNIYDSWIAIIVANIIAMSLYCIIQPIWLNNFINKKEAGDENYVQK